MLDLPRQRQTPQEVRQVVRQREQLQSRLVVFERAAGELRPLDGVLALLDPLLRRAATVVELHHALRLLGQVGHNEPDTGEQLARTIRPSPLRGAGVATTWLDTENCGERPSACGKGDLQAA